MIIDGLLTFANNLALNTGGAATYVIGDQVDLEATGTQEIQVGNIGTTGDLFLVVKTVIAPDSANDTATLVIQLVTADNDALTSNPVVLATTGAARAVTAMGANFLLGVIPLPATPAYKRYLGIRQVTDVQAFSAGSIDAFITMTPPNSGVYYDAPSQN